MKNGRMQAKDVSDRPVLEFIHRVRTEGVQGSPTVNFDGFYTWVTWFIQEDGTPYANSVANAMPTGTPKKLVLAKMKRLIARGLVDGCDCGCRGDFELTDKGREMIGQPPVERSPLATAAAMAHIGTVAVTPMWGSIIAAAGFTTSIQTAASRLGKTERAAQLMAERWKRGDRTPVVVYGHALDLVAPELLDEVGARIKDKGDFRLVTFDDRGDEEVARSDAMIVRALDERGIPLLVDLQVPLSSRELMMSIDVAGRNVEVQDIGFDVRDMLAPRSEPVSDRPGYLQHDPTKQVRRGRGRGRR